MGNVQNQLGAGKPWTLPLSLTWQDETDRECFSGQRGALAHGHHASKSPETLSQVFPRGNGNRSMFLVAAGDYLCARRFYLISFAQRPFRESEPDSVETGVLGTPDVAGYTACGWRLSKHNSYCGGRGLPLL